MSVRRVAGSVRSSFSTAAAAPSESRIPAWALRISPSAQNEIPVPYGRHRPCRHVTRTGCASTYASSSRDEAALAEARFADDRGEPDRALRDRSVEQARQAAQLLRSADEWRRAGSRQVDPESRPRRDRMEHPDRFGLALERRRRQLLVLEASLRRLPCRLADGDAHLRCDRLDSRRRVDGVASKEALAGPWGDIQPDKRRASVDPDPEPERRAAKGWQALGLLADPERGPDRSLRIVFVRLGHAEDADDGVADELFHDATVDLDEAPRGREISGQHPVDVFGICGLRRRGEADEIAEQRGDDLAFLGERDVIRQAATRSCCRTLTRRGSGWRRRRT